MITIASNLEQECKSFRAHGVYICMSMYEDKQQEGYFKHQIFVFFPRLTQMDLLIWNFLYIIDFFCEGNGFKSELLS